MRPVVSPRARLVAVICYLGLPLPYGALGTGRWDGLVAYAAFPFIALRLARAAACGAVRGRARPEVAQPPGGPGRRPRRRHRRGGGLRSRRRAAGHRHRAGVGAGLHAGRIARRRLADPRGGGGGDRRRPGAGRALGHRDAAGGEGIGGDLRPADRRGERPGLGRGHPLRHRARRPLAHRLAPRRGGGAPPRPRPGDPPDLGGAPVGHGVRVLGPRAGRVTGRPGFLHAVGVRGPRTRRVGRRRLRRLRHRRLRERPDRPRVRVAPGGERHRPGVRGARPPPRRGRDGGRPLGPPVPGSGAAARLPEPPEHGRRDAGPVAR